MIVVNGKKLSGLRKSFSEADYPGQQAGAFGRNVRFPAQGQDGRKGVGHKRGHPAGAGGARFRVILEDWVRQHA